MLAKDNKKHIGKIYMNAHSRQDMEFEAYNLIHSMWAAARQEELD